MDWDKFAAYMLLNYYEQDDRRQSTQVPQWKELKVLRRSDLLLSVLCLVLAYSVLQWGVNQISHGVVVKTFGSLVKL